MSELEIGFDASTGKQAALNTLMEQIMGSYSVSDDEGPLTDAVETFLTMQPHLTVHRHGDTLVASTDFGRAQRVILAGHLDTVPVIDNFPPKWLEPGDPLIREVVEAHPDWIVGDFAIIGEPTDCGIEGGCNGTMRFDVVTHGVAAHSARAWMGENAIHKAAEILNRLNAYENRAVEVDGLTYQEGLNATLISGGKGTNVIPDECRVHVNYRFAPDKTLAEAKALMIGVGAGAELGNGEHMATGGVFAGFGIEMKDESPSARPGLNSPLAASLVDLVRDRTGRDPLAKLGWTDVARFAILGIPAVNLGAGSPLLAHKHDEQLPESDLVLMADLLEDWLR